MDRQGFSQPFCSVMAKTNQDPSHKGCRTNPLPNTLESIKGYPNKLVIYRLQASPYWWVRYYVDKKILRKSTKEIEKRKAIAFAKNFYDEVNLKRLTGEALTPHTVSKFALCADAMLIAQEGRRERGEISQTSHDNDVLRMRKHIKPFFGSLDVKDVSYKKLEDFLSHISKDKLAPATLNYYLGLIKKVLTYAQLRGLLSSIPTFPKVKKKDSPRGWFTTKEYRRLCRGAADLAGTAFILKRSEKKTKSDNLLYWVKEGQKDARDGTLIRRVVIPKDLLNVITFMVNSFIRPTDLKIMQHKHVGVIDEGERHFLRLNLPKTKGHDTPIVTMRTAISVYKRQFDATIPSTNDKGKALPKERRISLAKDTYVFLPNEQNRDRALKELQVYFSLLTNHLGLKEGPNGEERTLYSLRHTCIMYRLMYGQGIDLLTLARNARTSPEMIDRFYARHLHGEMNLELIQSKRSKLMSKDSIKS